MKSEKDKEQAAFEAWAVRECPSGDVESVQYQWVTSPEYADLCAGESEGATQ